MPTVEEQIEQQRRLYVNPADRVRSKLFWFLKAPCPPEQCYYHLKYRHFTCLTCPVRRERENPKGKFRRYKRALLVLESASSRGFVLPKRYRTYGLFIPVGDDGKAAVWKRIILKCLLTIAERVAEA